MANIKKFMFLNRKAPHGSVYALESLEVVLIAGAFDQDISLIFIDDGVFQILKNQQTESLGLKNFSKTYNALGDYDITKLYVSQESLNERGLTLEDLLDLTYEDENLNWEEKSTISVVSNKEIALIMSEQDVCISF